MDKHFWKQFETIIARHLRALSDARERDGAKFSLLNEVSLSVEALSEAFDEFFLQLEELTMYAPEMILAAFDDAVRELTA